MSAEAGKQSPEMVAAFEVHLRAFLYMPTDGISAFREYLLRYHKRPWTTIERASRTQLARAKSKNFGGTATARARGTPRRYPTRTRCRCPRMAPRAGFEIDCKISLHGKNFSTMSPFVTACCSGPESFVLGRAHNTKVLQTTRRTRSSARMARGAAVLGWTRCRCRTRRASEHGNTTGMDQGDVRTLRASSACCSWGPRRRPTSNDEPVPSVCHWHCGLC